MSVQKISLLPGDGIGPEITQSVQDVFKAAGVPIEWEIKACGLEALDKTGSLLPDEVLSSIRENGFALKGPTTTPSGGGHRSINVSLRQELQLFANVRPIRSIPGLEQFHKNIDLVIVRENSEDLYLGIEYMIGDDTAHGIKVITRQASERIGRFAFEYAQKNGRKKVSIAHKANIMKQCDGLFLRSIQAVAQDYPGIVCEDVIIDACCMHLVKNPERFDVIVTQNLYGDIISDLASGLVGGLGLASGVNIGNGIRVYEAVHGSAPDIAGQDLANPSALLFSAIMMLKDLGLSDHSIKIESALLGCLETPKTRTKDIGGALGTKAFTAELVRRLG
jgi:isocitrate dehydrogenase (NAD+)